MSYTIIKENINRLLKERDWRIADLENKLGAGRSVANILRGTSKNPTIELLTSIAKAFNIEIQELLNEPLPQKDVDTSLLLKICNKVIKELEKLEISSQMTYSTIMNVIREVYEYSIHLDLKDIDDNFIKWTIHKYHISK